MIYLTLFAFTYGLVAIRSFQQINVTQGYRIRIPPTSYAFAAMEVLTLSNVVTVVVNERSLPLAVLAMGTAGWMGALSSMHVQSKLNGIGGERK
jgi:hypothetical protein